MSALIWCGFCFGDGCSACDELAEPACEACGAPTDAQCECSEYEAVADTDESLGLEDRKFAPS